MKIDPRHLQILAAIVDAGGLTEGATQLGKSQPSVSRTLAALEARIGARLFKKGKRPLQPTELGAALAAEGRSVGRATKAAARTVSEFSGGTTGSVRLAGTPIFMDGVIAHLIAGFQVEFPSVRIDQSYGYVRDLTERLSLDQIDLAICPLNKNQVPDGFSFQPLLPGRNVIACSATHPLARKTSLRLEDMAPFPWIAPPGSSPLHDDLLRVVREIGIANPQISFSGGSLSAILSILEGSSAITVLPYLVVFMQRHLNLLRSLPIRIEHPERDLGILALSGQTLRPAVRRLARSFDQRFQSLRRIMSEAERRTVWHQ